MALWIEKIAALIVRKPVVEFLSLFPRCFAKSVDHFMFQDTDQPSLLGPLIGIIRFSLERKWCQVLQNYINDVTLQDPLHGDPLRSFLKYRQVLSLL